MSETELGRRSFLGLLSLALAGCKIEPIYDLPPTPVEEELLFPDLPPQLPDQLADAETTLRAVTKQVFERELAPLTTGTQRLRAAEDPAALALIVEIVRSFGLDPAGERGGWLLPVPLSIVEHGGQPPTVRLRPKPKTDATMDAPGEPSTFEALELAPHGAFRQRGEAAPATGLPITEVIDFARPLPKGRLAGRVALLRAPRDLDLAAADAPAYVDVLLSALRDAGAVGGLLLTRDEGPGIERLRRLWHRQVRVPVASPGATLLIEGVLDAEGTKALSSELSAERARVLDVDLATHEIDVQSHNVAARITGRERPGEAVVLTCAWDTPDPATVERDTLRLLTTLAAFHQLAEWSRRGTPPRYSLVLLLSADAGLAAGQSVHASWSAQYGARTSALLALDRPSRERGPALMLAGHYDQAIAELARRVVSEDGRELLLADQLTMPSLAPYLRYPAPVMSIGAPSEEALADAVALPDEKEGEEEDEPDGTESNEQTRFDSLYGDIRVLRNLMLALAARR